MDLACGIERSDVASYRNEVVCFPVVGEVGQVELGRNQDKRYVYVCVCERESILLL